jgi:hypothetical protein
MFGSTYASMSFRAIMNQLWKKLGWITMVGSRASLVIGSIKQFYLST